MKSIIVTISASILTFALGIGTGIFFTKYTQKDETIPPKSVQTRQISGAKIRVKPISTTGSTFTFQTEAEGSGTAETKIEKRIIPEAASWMDKTNSIQIQTGLINVNQSFEPLLELSYWKRWNTISLGCGVGFSESTYAIKVGIMYMF